MSTLLNVLVVLIGIAGVFFFKSERTNVKARGMAWLSGALAIIGVLNLLLHLAVWVILLVTIVLIAAGVYHYRHDDKVKANKVTKASSAGSIAVLALTLILGSGVVMNSAQSDGSNPNAVVAMVDGKPKEFIPVNSSGPIKYEKPTTDAITFYAYKAEPGTNNDGPAITLNSAVDGLARLGEKVGNDPAYLAQVTEYDVAHEGFDNARAQRRAEMYAQNADARHNDAAAFMENIKSADLVDMSGVRYDSTGMIPSENWDESKMPQLTKFSVQPDMGQTLVVVMKDGDVLFFRVKCDLQPSAPHFPNVSPPATPEKPAVTPPTPYVPPTPPTKVTPPPPKTTPPTSPPTTTPPKTTPPTTTPPTTTPPTTTPPTTTPPTTTPPTTTPPTTTPPTTTPTKDPSVDPCKTGNDPHGCQTDNGDPITADPTPSDPAVPESEAPATYTPPPPPPPTTTERETPVPTENQGVPTDNPVTGDIGDNPAPGPGNGGDDGSNDGGCPVCGPVDDGSGNGGNQPPAQTDNGPAAVVPVVPAPADPGANGGNDAPSGPAVDEGQAPAEQQPAAQPEPAAAPAADANPESVSIVPTAFSRSTSQDNLASIVLALVAGALVGVAFAPAHPRGRKRQH